MNLSEYLHQNRFLSTDQIEKIVYLKNRVINNGRIYVEDLNFMMEFPSVFRNKITAEEYKQLRTKAEEGNATHIDFLNLFHKSIQNTIFNFSKENIIELSV